MTEGSSGRKHGRTSRCILRAAIPLDPLAKEQFFHRETNELLHLLDGAAHQSGKSRGQAFEDFLELVVCALSGRQMEEAYLKVAQRYVEGEPGKRGIDRLAEMFGALVRIMEDTRGDVLGDLYQGAITRGENGQYMTPESVTDLMAQLAGHDDDGSSKTVSDSCCGSGRMLLSAAEVNPHREFIGQDLDLRCVRMTAINLALRNLYGLVVWGNALKGGSRLAYRTGFNGQGFIREVPLATTKAAAEERQLIQAEESEPEAPVEPLREVPAPARQGLLFE